MIPTKARREDFGRWNFALVVAAIALGAVTFFAVEHWRRAVTPVATAKIGDGPLPSAIALPSNEAATVAAIRFYTERVQRDSEDTRAQNALAEYYLQRVRESGNEDDLPLALAAARASLAAIEAGQNIGGLTALAHAELANHDFAAAREHALQLVALDPTKSEPRAILGDACLELGDYELAAQAFGEMEKLGGNNVGTHTRLARLAYLRGNPDQARTRFSTALILLLDLPSPPREAVAWCRWQLGETAFSTGDYEGAERHYRDALTTAPGYFRALGSMGRLCATRGDLASAINYHEQAARIAPSVSFMAALGDLYQRLGREREAATRYELVEQLGEHSRRVHGTPFDRAIALFCADHDLKVEEAYALARGEYDAGRHDIYGADALAWTALEANRLDDAQAAIKEAPKLGTLDAKLFYHAGMIARRAGDCAAATDYLQRALVLNPGFDPLQSEIARRALKEISP
ncbi:MAG: tetratricopeptide repeat protein [Verrucomicrobiota bacterium]|nr:tetratricopeptide repeat protein [Verrucomicrobiota bacterium]